MNQRLGLLSTMLLALGVVEPPPPRKEENLAEAEQVMRDLSAAGIDIHDLAAAVGAEGFVAYGKAILEVHRHLLATGTTETSVTKLLGIFNAYIQPKPVDMRRPGVVIGVDMAAPAVTRTWARLCAMPREPRTHNRPTQRASKKTRARTKSRRGW